MSDASEPCSGCSTSSTVFSYTLFSWSLNRVKVVRRVFSPAVSAGVSRDLQTDRNFPSAHSSYNHKLSLLAQHLATLVLKSELISLASWEGTSVWYLLCTARAPEMIRVGSFITRLEKLMLVCRSLWGCVQASYCKPRASSVWQAKDCNINTRFWKPLLYWQMSE